MAKKNTNSVTEPTPVVETAPEPVVAPEPIVEAEAATEPVVEVEVESIALVDPEEAAPVVTDAERLNLALAKSFASRASKHFTAGLRQAKSESVRVSLESAKENLDNGEIDSAAYYTREAILDAAIRDEFVPTDICRAYGLLDSATKLKSGYGRPAAVRKMRADMENLRKAAVGKAKSPVTVGKLERIDCDDDISDVATQATDAVFSEVTAKGYCAIDLIRFRNTAVLLDVLDGSVEHEGDIMDLLG